MENSKALEADAGFVHRTDASRSQVVPGLCHYVIFPLLSLDTRKESGFPRDHSSFTSGVFLSFFIWYVRSSGKCKHVSPGYFPPTFFVVELRGKHRECFPFVDMSRSAVRS